MDKIESWEKKQRGYAKSARERMILSAIYEARQKQHELRMQAAGATASVESLENHIWDLKELLAELKEKNSDS